MKFLPITSKVNKLFDFRFPHNFKHKHIMYHGKVNLKKITAFEK